MNVQPLAGALPAGFPHVLDTGGFTSPMAPVLRAGRADGAALPGLAILQALDDGDAMSPALGAAVIAWSRASLVKADGSGLVSAAYNLAGNPNFASVSELPRVKTRSNGVRVFDFLDAENAATDQAAMVMTHAATQATAPGLTVAASIRVTAAPVVAEYIASQRGIGSDYDRLALVLAADGHLHVRARSNIGDPPAELAGGPAPVNSDLVVVGTIGFASRRVALYVAGASGAAVLAASAENAVAAIGTAALAGTFLAFGNGYQGGATSRFRGEIVETIELSVAADQDHADLRAELVSLLQRGLSA